MTTIAQLEVEQAVGKDMASALFDIAREWDGERHHLHIAALAITRVICLNRVSDTIPRTGYGLSVEGPGFYREIQTTWLSDKIPRDEDAIAWLLLAVWLAPTERLTEWFRHDNSCVTIGLAQVLGL